MQIIRLSFLPQFDEIPSEAAMRGSGCFGLVLAPVLGASRSDHLDSCGRVKIADRACNQESSAIGGNRREREGEGERERRKRRRRRKSSSGV